MKQGDTICSLIRSAEQNYVHGTVRIGSHVNFSMHDTIQTIIAYLNSKHISGKRDSLGREKPFFNICTAVANIWYRATDIDRKDIRIIADKSENVALAFVATVLLQDWMIRERFAVFLNLWGRALSRYGSIPSKFVRKDGRLIPSVIEWSRFIPDPVSFDALPSIEKLYYTPEQLKKNSAYDQKQISLLIQAAGEARKNAEGEQVDLNNNFIEVYEVHGELPLALLKKEPKDKDWELYRQQMHAVSFVGTSGEKEYKDFTLFSGKERDNPYMITHLIEEEGRTLSIGAVEYLFDAQWMVNHTIKAQRDYLDLASKLLFQTADQSFIGRNVLSAIESGEILIHKENKPLTQISNAANNMNALIQFGNQWLVLAKEITSTPDALRGNTMPSGTPYSLVSILQQQAGSLFEIMTENKGLAIEDMLRQKVLPFLKIKMDSSKEIAVILDEHNITQLDALYVPREAVRRFNNDAIEKLIAGEVPSPYQSDISERKVREGLAAFGNQRFLKPSDIPTKTWKEVLKDFEWDVKVEITNEMHDKQALLTSLNSTFQTIMQASKGNLTGEGKVVLNRILSLTGAISPLELSRSHDAELLPA